MRQAEAHLGRILILNFTKVDLNPMKYKLNICAAIVVLVAAAPMHSDKISHLTSTLFTCLQIIKHNIAYMSAVGAKYAEVYFAT